MIDIQPKVVIDGKKYYTKTQTLIEVFRKDFEQIYEVLENAIRQHRKVLWEFI